MQHTVTLDAAGRVLIPKCLRDALQLEAGDEFELTTEGERMTLRPVRTGAGVLKEQGVWVFRRTGPIITDEATNRVLYHMRAGRGAGEHDYEA